MMRKTAKDGGSKVKAIDDLLDAQQVADVFRVAKGTIYNWAYQRKLTKIKPFGSRGPLRFEKSEIEAIIKKSRQPALASD